MLTAIKFKLFGDHDPSLSAFLWTRWYNAPYCTYRDSFWYYLARRFG
jgi:hypothetical protein